MTFQALLGIVSGILALGAYPIYIHGIFRGSVRPNRATWWILALASTILAASYFAEGARNTMWVALAYVLGNLAIAILSVKYGDGEWSALDKLCLFAALASAALWVVLDEPFIALMVNIGIDFIGIVPTIYKSYRKPHTESRPAWSIDVVAGVLALLAIETPTFSIIIYPAYLTLVNSIIAALIFKDRHTRRSNIRV